MSSTRPDERSDPLDPDASTRPPTSRATPSAGAPPDGARAPIVAGGRRPPRGIEARQAGGRHQPREAAHVLGDAEQVEGHRPPLRANMATAIIGPSGCGKSTLIRCLNRMHEVTPGATVDGKVFLDQQDIYALDAAEVRSRIGMVFQKPNPFPTMSIYQNVASGLRLTASATARSSTRRSSAR